MRKLIALCLFIILTSPKSNFAASTKQPIPITNKVNITSGTVFKDRLGGFSVIGSSDKFTYGTSSKGSEITLYQIANNANITKTADFRLADYNGLKRSKSSINVVDNQIYLFTSTIDKKTDKYIFMFEPIDMNTLMPSGKITKLDEIEFEKKRNRGSFSIVVSPDESKILLYKDLPYEKEGKEKYSLTVLDSKMNKLWTSDIEMPYTDKDIQLQKVYIDNSGDVIVSAKKFTDIKSGSIKGEDRKSNLIYDFMLLFISEKGKEIKEFELDIEKKWLTDAKFGIKDDGNIVGAGFYSEKSSYGIKGVFFASIDKREKKVTKYSLKEFSVDFMYAKLSERKKEKAIKKEEQGKGRGLLQFTFRDLVMREDGGVLLMAEQNYVVVNCTTDPKTGAQRCTYTYHYNDIVVVNVSPSGDIEWANWVPKRQISVSPYFLSYDLHVSKDKMHFLFNDNIKNYQLPKDELIKKMFSFGNPKKGIITIVSMDIKGNQEREALFLKDVHSLTFVPNVGRQINNTDIIMFSQKGSKKRFSLLNFK